jgi:hypothetical protein
VLFRSFLLRYSDEALPSASSTLFIEKGTIETIEVKDFDSFDRKEFRNILQKIANKKSHELKSLNVMANMVAITSRRGCANIFICHPSDQKYVKNYQKALRKKGGKGNDANPSVLAGEGSKSEGARALLLPPY